MAEPDRYLRIRRDTERWAEPLGPEDQTVQSMPDVSPTTWHRAHVTWFFETFVLERHERGFRPHHPAYRELFNSYYEAVGPRFPRPRRGVITRPGVAEITEYRAAVDARMVEVLTGTDDPALDALVELGLHHEQQHQELLLMDIKHVLGQNPLEPVYRPTRHPDPAARAGEPAWVELDGGLVSIGHAGEPSDSPDNLLAGTFSYDNERPRHRVHLEPFALADRLVTVGEWRAFVADGGYQRPELWLSDGWAAVVEHGWTAPLYWTADHERVHTLGGTRPLTDAEPVCHVSHYEADAFARWAGARLPTETEWEHAATTVDGWSPCGADPDRLHPWPTDGSGPGPLRQLTGHCWQWTASAYLPYPGFAADPGAVGEYNGKFMSGQMVLRGGSALTPDGHVRPSYRNFFPPDARWPMTGVRLATGGTPT